MLTRPTVTFETTSTLSPLQQSIATMLGSNIAAGSQLGSSQDVADALHSGLTSDPTTGISPEATNDYINKSVAVPLLRQFDQSIMPRIKDSFASVGALLGSRRALATQNALEGIQTTIASELGKAQLANQTLSAQLREQMAQRQGQQALQQQQLAQGYGQLGLGLTGQSHLAIQPIRQSFGGIAQGPSNFQFAGANRLVPQGFLSRSPSFAQGGGYQIAGNLPYANDNPEDLYGDFNKPASYYA